MKSLSILILSSRSKEHSANFGQDYMDSLIGVGHRVDFYNVEELLGNRHKKKRKQRHCYTLLKKTRILSLFHAAGLFLEIERSKPFQRYGFFMVNGRENNPDVCPHDLIPHLGDSYDAIITLFWYNDLSSYSLKVLYEYYQCPIFIISVDMAPMTGGCFYFGNCSNYSIECKHCPAVSGYLYNFAHQNFLNKKRNYSSIELIYMCNTYMSGFAKKTNLFKDIVIQSALINPSTFHPIALSKCLLYFNIPQNKTFLISIRFSKNEVRKGYHLAVKAVRHFSDKLTLDEKAKVLVLLIGTDSTDEESISRDFDTDSICLGKLDLQSLVMAYNVSNIFLCSSTDDAGPSMINQSMMCSTPVISFDTGTAKDVVIDGVSGYKVPLKRDEILGDRILTVFRMDKERYKQLRKTTLETALSWNSPAVFVNSFETAYKRYRGYAK